MKKILTASLSILAACTIFTGCASLSKDINQDLTAEELKLKAYEYSSNGNYMAAERYYQEALKRFGTNIEVSISCKYEIAHMNIKQKKYDKAEALLTEVLAYYSANPMLPAQYKKLSENDLQKIMDKKAKQTKKKK
ncbi:MAG: hypothetical protein K6G52_00320 [Treponemataceae bacterium]|nr:hypothetical protein [Treponemataceae bacterium]